MNFLMRSKKHGALAGVIAALVFTLTTAQAQPGAAGSGLGRLGPQFSGYLFKILADNPAFTANVEFHSYAVATVNGLLQQGKLSYLNASSRFETDITPGDPNVPLLDSSLLKQMGMDRIITISRPDLNMNYVVYPGMQAYVQTPIPAPANYQVDSTFAGYENVLGQNCTKSNVVVTGSDGVGHALTVWSATDLNSFPIKIQSDEGGTTTFMLFRDVNLNAPDGTVFVPTATFKKYDDFRSLMASRASGLVAR